MFPIFFVIGLINILAKHSNYGIKITDPNFNVRVRRSIQDTDTRERYYHEIRNNIIKDVKSDVSREKRYAYYSKIKITNHDLPRYNYSNGNSTRNGYNLSNSNFVTQNNGNRSLVNGWTNTTNRHNDNRYNIFNSTWNYLFNTNRNYFNRNNNSGVNGNRNSGYISNNNYFHRNNITNTFRGSYPYGYPTGYGPKSTGYNSAASTTPGYTNANDQPYFYNYQYPNRQNFGGYYGFNTSTPGYNNTPSPGYNNFSVLPVPYIPGYTQKPVNYSGFNNTNGSIPITNNILAPWTPGYAQTRGNYTGFNNNNLEPWKTPYTPGYTPIPVNNAGQAYNNTPLAYTPKPGNNIYNDRSPYAPGYTPNPGNNTATAKNNLPAPFATGNNSSITPGYGSSGNGHPDNNTETTTVLYTGCVICNIPCPQFMKRFGKWCIPEGGEDDDY